MTAPGHIKSFPPGESMVVAGVMSGTSADGVDVAVCRIGPEAEQSPAIKLLGHRAFPYPGPVREAVLGAMAAEAISVAELSRLNWRLGALYAVAVQVTCTELQLRPELVGCHGQTIYHQAEAETFLGAPVRATWQTGEAAVLAERLRCPVVSDFRPADVAADGQGAPLVAMLDAVMFRSASVGRVLANLGGIGNLTALPAGVGMEHVLAFDTGPGNMVIDACMRRLFGREFDMDGAVAGRGRPLDDLVERELLAPYFHAAPPKSCGREQFGEHFTEGFLKRCQEAGAGPADVVATATALTARSMVAAYDGFVADHLHGAIATEFVVAGGGTKNGALMAMLETALRERSVTLRRTDEFGVPADAKEAIAFALLAWLTWHRLPGTVMGATGATRPVVLGKVSLA